MKYFITTFKQNKEDAPEIDIITGYYDLRSLFNAMEILYQDGVPFCVYEANCILDLS